MATLRSSTGRPSPGPHTCSSRDRTWSLHKKQRLLVLVLYCCCSSCFFLLLLLPSQHEPFRRLQQARSYKTFPYERTVSTSCTANFVMFIALQAFKRRLLFVGLPRPQTTNQSEQKADKKGYTLKTHNKKKPPDANVLQQEKNTFLKNIFRNTQRRRVPGPVQPSHYNSSTGERTVYTIRVHEQNHISNKKRK